jgi:hypothetical protein
MKESLSKKLWHLAFPGKEEKGKEEEDLYIVDPFERFERAIREESERKS